MSAVYEPRCDFCRQKLYWHEIEAMICDKCLKVDEAYRESMRRAPAPRPRGEEQ